MGPEDLDVGEWYFFGPKKGDWPKTLFRLKEVTKESAAYNPLLKPDFIIEVYDNGALVQGRGAHPAYNSISILSRMFKWTNMGYSSKREIISRLFYEGTSFKV